jgi:hypothetical protein
LGSLLSQTILHGGPVVLAVLGGAPAEVTVLFSTLALFRAPYLIGIGLTLRSTGPVSRLVIAGDHRGIIRVSAWIAGAAGGLAVLAAAAGYYLGPPVVALVFGEATRPGAWQAAAVAAGSMLAIAGLWQFVGLIAAGRERALVGCWLAAVTAAAGVIAAWPGGATDSVVAGFTVGEMVASSLMAASLIGWAAARRQERSRSGEVGT